MKTYTRDNNKGHENAPWFAEIFASNQNVMRIVVASRSSVTEYPGTATYQPGDAKVFIHPFDRQSDAEREAYRRHLLENLHTRLGEYARNEREIEIFGQNPTPVAL
jgi:hypothetical protein